MKFKTQKAVLCHYLLNGNDISIMDGFKLFGITNVPREISRSVERSFGVLVIRIESECTNRYGHTCRYYSYRLWQPIRKRGQEYILFGNITNKQQEIGMKKMLKYVIDNMVTKKCKK